MTAEAETLRFKSVEASLLRNDTIPLFSKAHPFPWEEFAHSLAETFALEGLTIEPTQQQWVTPDNAISGIGTPQTCLNVVIASLEGSLSWIMADQDWDQLASWLLRKKSRGAPISDSAIREGFIRFIGLETLHLVEQIGFAEGISPRLDHQGKLPQEESVAVDVTLKYNQSTLSGRLLVSATLLRSWKEKFAPRQPTSLSPELASKLDIELHLELGRTAFSAEEWSQVECGDCIILDACTWDPNNKKGQLTLSIDETPLFQGGIQENGSVEILNTVTKRKK